MPKNYIPSPDYLTDMYANPCYHGRWRVVEKVSISQIKINKSLFSFHNEVDPTEVERICKDFHIEVWYPIMVNSEYFLLDGQHRLAAAKRMKLKYIDIVVDHGEIIEETKPKRKSKEINL
jgi:ParB-like chromosome segregation protein Spo0J